MRDVWILFGGFFMGGIAGAFWMALWFSYVEERSL